MFKSLQLLRCFFKADLILSFESKNQQRSSSYLLNAAELISRLKQRLTCSPVLTEAPSFAEPGDSIIDRVASTKVVIPCPAEGTKSFTAESRSD